jgi:hypothetical protein
MASFLLLFSACNIEETKKERWPGPWQRGNNKEISTTLTENKVLLCKEYKYKVPAKTGEAHLVRCTPDYKEWSTYMVWIQLNKVLGPYKTDPVMD